MSIVVCNSLLSCTGNSVVMLVDTKVVKKLVLGSKNILQRFVIKALIKNLLSIQLVRGVEVTGSSSDVAFIVSAGAEVSSPVSIRVVTVWEHVIVFGGPCDVVASNSINVVTWG